MPTTTLPAPTPRPPANVEPPLEAPVALDLDLLDRAVAADGVAAHEAAVARLTVVARAARVCPTLVDALVDPTHAPALRTRAYARVTLALAFA